MLQPHSMNTSKLMLTIMRYIFNDTKMTLENNIFVGLYSSFIQIVRLENLQAAASNDNTNV